LDTKHELQVSTIQASSYAETLQNVPTLQEWINSVLDAMPRLPSDPENVTEEQQERYQVRENLEICLDNHCKAFGGDDPEHPTQYTLER
jgi:hypothetical protein